MVMNSQVTQLMDNHLLNATLEERPAERGHPARQVRTHQEGAEGLFFRGGTMVARNVGGVGSPDLRQHGVRCDWWTVTQLADHYGLAARTIYAAIARVELVAHRFGGRRRGIRIADADRLDCGSKEPRGRFESGEPSPFGRTAPSPARGEALPHLDTDKTIHREREVGPAGPRSAPRLPPGERFLSGRTSPAGRQREVALGGADVQRRAEGSERAVERAELDVGAPFEFRHRLLRDTQTLGKLGLGETDFLTQPCDHGTNLEQLAVRLRFSELFLRQQLGENVARVFSSHRLVTLIPQGSRSIACRPALLHTTRGLCPQALSYDEYSPDLEPDGIPTCQV